MSTANFGTPNFNLPLIAIGMGDDEDQNYWAYEDAEADLKLLNNELGYFTVYLESGYYQGAMYNVKQTNDYIDYDQIDDFDDEDMDYYFGDTKANVKKGITQELDKIKKFLAEKKDEGALELIKVAQFSNGEAFYKAI
jgi:hypothetical protein